MGKIRGKKMVGMIRDALKKTTKETWPIGSFYFSHPIGFIIQELSQYKKRSNSEKNPGIFRAESKIIYGLIFLEKHLELCKIYLS